MRRTDVEIAEQPTVIARQDLQQKRLAPDVDAKHEAATEFRPTSAEPLLDERVLAAFAYNTPLVV